MKTISVTQPLAAQIPTFPSSVRAGAGMPLDTVTTGGSPRLRERPLSAEVAQMMEDMAGAEASMREAEGDAKVATPLTAAKAPLRLARPGALRNPAQTQVYLVGGGIASLAAAVFLVRDAHVPGENIHILEESGLAGGSLDGSGSADAGYLMRGGRMFEEHFLCTYDLLASIPSLDDPDKSVKEDTKDAYREASWNDKSRLVDKNGRIVDVSTMGFSNRDRLEMLKLTIASEESLGTKGIDEVFSPHFFETNFWHMWCSMFAFEPWHSAVEMKRYMLRFIHLFPTIADMTGIQKTRYNQFDSMVRPIMNWLRKESVNFDAATRVTDLDVNPPGSRQTVDHISYERNGKAGEIPLGESDIVIVTNGSMTAASTEGSMTAPPTLNTGDPGVSWTLWKHLAKDRPNFGHPEVFCSDIDKTKWESFTVTTGDPTFPALFEGLTQQTLGRAGLMTFKDSSWRITVDAFRNPVYPGQPDDKSVWWGYGLFPDKEGDYVHKKMSDCTGEEILTEVFSHLHLDKQMPSLIQNSKCRLAMMPYITSQFMPRAKGDRPDVVPQDSTNLAFVGQYCEMPDDTVFTVEYSVRSAMEAVYKLMGVDRTAPPVYKGQHDIGVLYRALKTTLK